MKFLVASLVAMIAAASAEQEIYKTVTPEGSEITLTRMDDNAFAVADIGASKTECNLCFELLNAGEGQLLQIIEQAGIVGSCAELCSKAFPKNKLENQVCDGICSAVGVAAFQEVLKKAGGYLDPIPICEELKACEFVAGGNVKMHSFSASPNPVPVFSTTVLTAEFSVLNRTSTGEMSFNIAGGSAGGIVMPTPPGNYRADCKVPTGQGQGPGVGTYNAEFALCAGECGDNKHGHVYASAKTSITVKPQSEE